MKSPVFLRWKRLKDRHTILHSAAWEIIKSNYNSTEPYAWRGNTISDILSKPEYMGHTVNFRTYKESYKDKRSKATPKEDLVIFENTQEAIIDKETWERVQSLTENNPPD